jgi:hypothetical protein
MERNFTNENFERFLRKNADGFRMQPSDKVWKGISKHLNGRRRKFGFILGISLLVSTSLTYYLIEKQNSNITSRTEKTNRKTESIPSKNNPELKQIHGVSGPIGIVNNNLLKTIRSSSIPGLLNLNNTPVNLSSTSENRLSFTNSLITRNDFTPTIVDSYLEKDPDYEDSPLSQTNSVSDPLSIESVTNSFQQRIRKSKLDFQVYFTPTVSYRKLSENKSFLASSAANNPTNYPGLNNINSMVTHKPDFGFEIGVAAKYPLSRNLKLRGGLQFNVNRYDIKVFNSPAQFATIRLTNGFDSLSTITRYNNISNYSGNSGYKTNWLQNFYFQVSAPVGLEFKLRGDDKMQFGVATTIQPTYVLGDRAYLISSDYKNYSEVPWLIRRWNINTNLETFVSYSTGRLKWQVGPQVRYQLLSSFVKKYPVKENLFDFGLKVGISLNNQ